MSKTQKVGWDQIFQKRVSTYYKGPYYEGGWNNQKKGNDRVG